MYMSLYMLFCICQSKENECVLAKVSASGQAIYLSIALSVQIFINMPWKHWKCIVGHYNYTCHLSTYIRRCDLLCLFRSSTVRKWEIDRSKKEKVRERQRARDYIFKLYRVVTVSGYFGMNGFSLSSKWNTMYSTGYSGLCEVSHSLTWCTGLIYFLVFQISK